MPTGGSTPATTYPGTSSWPSEGATSPTLTNLLARSWTPTGALADSASQSQTGSSPIGDRIVCLRNSDVLGVKNGTCATVERVDRDNRTLTAVTDRGPTVELSRRYLETGNVRHAYALTGHAAQGLTVERAFVLGAGEARLQEWGYVALSRARAETRLYVTGNPREHESHFHDLDDRDPLARFGRALEESAIEELAVDQRPLPSGPKHDARPEIERSSLSPEQQMRRRLLEQKRRALLKTRDTAERRLEAAERRLARCGAFRRRSRDELRREVDLLRHAIDGANERLAEAATLLQEVRSVGRPERASDCRSSELDAPTREKFHLSLERDSSLAGYVVPTGGSVGASGRGSRCGDAAISVRSLGFGLARGP